MDTIVTRKLVLASSNQGKLEELGRFLPAHFSLLTQSELGITSAEETGWTFVENAVLKARHAAEMSGLPALADDSGLEVDVLQGSPGIFSARFAGESASDHDNNLKLLSELEGVAEAQRTARFHCVIVYLKHPKDPAPVIASGRWEGRILTAPAGDNGFGYDPLFFDPSLGCASAELSATQKHQHSHRGQALRQLADLLGL